MSDTNTSLIVAPAIAAVELTPAAQQEIADTLAKAGPVVVITSADEYQQAAAALKLLSALAKQVEAAREQAKRPLIDAGRRLDAAVASAVKPVEERIAGIKREMVAHGQRVEAERQRVERERQRLIEEQAERERQAEQEREQAAAKRFAEEQAKRKEEQEAAALLGLDLPTEAPAPAPAPEPPPAPAPVLLLPTAPPVARAAGTAITTRLVATVTDETAVPRDLCSSDSKKIHGYAKMHEDRIRKAVEASADGKAVENGITYTLSTNVRTSGR